MTTLEELQALPDQDLIDKVARKVMGWEGWAISARQFDAVCICGRTAGAWDPLTNWNHTMQIVREMREKGHSFLLSEGKGAGNFSLQCVFHYKGSFGDRKGRSQSANPQRAVCVAALLALSPLPA